VLVSQVCRVRTIPYFRDIRRSVSVSRVLSWDAKYPVCKVGPTYCCLAFASIHNSYMAHECSSSSEACCELLYPVTLLYRAVTVIPSSRWGVATGQTKMPEVSRAIGGNRGMAFLQLIRHMA